MARYPRKKPLRQALAALVDAGMDRCLGAGHTQEQFVRAWRGLRTAAGRGRWRGWPAGELDRAAELLRRVERALNGGDRDRG